MNFMNIYANTYNSTRQISKILINEVIQIMKKKFTIVIFTDLDGSLLHRDTFEFDPIKNFIKDLINKGIIIIPNSSKTEKEIEKFNEELGIELPYISENGSVIHGLNLINQNFPNKIILSREKEELLKIFNIKVPEKIKDKCHLISKMKKEKQEKIFGQKGDRLKDVLNRNYTLPFIFSGEKIEKNKLLKILSFNSLTLQEGGRVSNLCDNVNKIKSMNRVVKILKKTEEKIKTITVGDNYNDLDMLKNSDVPCLVFNDLFKLDQINIDNLIFSNKPSPEGWADVVKKALVKLEYNV